MKDAIKKAIWDIKPAPAWLEIGEPTLYELLRECNRETDDWRPRETSEPDDGGKFMGVPIKVRKYLIGWRVTAIIPEHFIIFDKNVPPDEVFIAPERGEQVRGCISSDDFDEREQLKYEEFLKRRRG